MKPLLDSSLPIVDDSGRMSAQFRTWTLKANLAITITGIGSPEGVVDALQTQEYMDTTGAAGAIKWIKRDADIGGNTKRGWVLV
jgi:hypothetical protein